MSCYHLSERIPEVYDAFEDAVEFAYDLSDPELRCGFDNAGFEIVDPDDIDEPEQSLTMYWMADEDATPQYGQMLTVTLDDGAGWDFELHTGDSFDFEPLKIKVDAPSWGRGFESAEDAIAAGVKVALLHRAAAEAKTFH